MIDVIFYSLPGNFVKITSGSARTDINLSRPWQSIFTIAPEKCPFCTKSQKEIFRQDLPDGWRVIENMFSPHRHHRLIIPKSCWETEILWKLGGRKCIQQALEIFHLITNDDPLEMAMFIHVGQSAGQNLTHAHWHVAEVRVQTPLDFINIATRSEQLYFFECLVLKGEKMSIFAAGARAGECLILERRGEQLLFQEAIEELATIIELIVNLGNEKFCSIEDKLPDFIVTIRKSAAGYFLYADYCPILNMWGAPEYVISTLEGGPITLPWPHKLTAAYLSS